MKHPQIIVFTGLQASGKTSFYHKNWAATHSLISKDLMRNRKHKNIYQLKLVRRAIEQGLSVVIDNTNPTPADRSPIILIAQEYAIQVVSYFFPPNLTRSLERNRERPTKTRVPDIALYATLKILQPPTQNEGFHQRFEVVLDEASEKFFVTGPIDNTSDLLLE